LYRPSSLGSLRARPKLANTGFAFSASRRARLQVRPSLSVPLGTGIRRTPTMPSKMMTPNTEDKITMTAAVTTDADGAIVLKARYLSF